MVQSIDMTQFDNFSDNISIESLQKLETDLDYLLTNVEIVTQNSVNLVNEDLCNLFRASAQKCGMVKSCKKVTQMGISMKLLSVWTN